MLQPGGRGHVGGGFECGQQVRLRQLGVRFLSFPPQAADTGLGPSPAWREFVQYARLVDEKQAELKAMTVSNPALYQAFATDLDRLERSYQTLKADLPENPNQETLVQAMIQNLQLQINLLNEQLRVIQRMKAQNNNTNGHLI